MLPATLDTHAESLLMLRAGARPGEMLALRLWSVPTRLQPQGSTGPAQTLPLWIGSVQTLQHQRALEFVGMWRPLREAGSSLDALAADIGGLPHILAPHPASQLPVLRIRTDRGAAE
ncbi:MAG: hypothetical protein EOP92_39200 [Lysobacteraceae bacterium]|nr:MAG: hypothetical protein EOP92_39200 [Xanthomonadaceae bacterium]